MSPRLRRSCGDGVDRPILYMGRGNLSEYDLANGPKYGISPEIEQSESSTHGQRIFKVKLAFYY